MTYTPETSALYTALVECDRLLAESPAFQQRVEAADPAAARAKIQLLEFEDDPAALRTARPFACLWPEATQWKAAAGGVRNEFDCEGTVTVLITDIDRHPGGSPQDRRDSGLDFLAWIGAVIEEVLSHAAEDDFLAITGISMNRATDGPFRTPTKDEASAGGGWWCQFHVHVGGGG